MEEPIPRLKSTVSLSGKLNETIIFFLDKGA